MVSALCLARAGVRSIVVERAASLSTHPKAHELNARSIEILTGLGFTLEELEAEASPPSDAARVVFCRTLGDELGRIDLLSPENHPEKYRRHLRAAVPYLNLSQTELEKALLARVQADPLTRIMFEHEWQRFEETPASITSTVRRASDDTVVRIRSRYVVAADGAASGARRALHIEMEGPDELQDFVNAYFEADLSKLVRTRGKLYWLLDPEAAGTLIAHHVERRWVYHVPIYQPHERPEDYTEEVFVERIRKAVGVRDLPIRIRSISYWRMTAQVAARFRAGRVFLVGDAAHRFPPTGGLGMNTGIADAHNLCWKLAAVLAEQADATLLDTYEQERRPVAKRNCEESKANYDKLFEVMEAFGLPRSGLAAMARLKASAPVRWLPRSWRQALVRVLEASARRALAKFDRDDALRRRVRSRIAAQTPHFDRIGLDIGYVYESGALVPDRQSGSKGRTAVTEYVPSTQPGARFPHLWLDSSRRRSSHDVLQEDGYTLILGDEGALWTDALRSLEPLRSRLKVERITSLCEGEEAFEALRDLCRLGSHGALLVRPDGHIAWREHSSTPNPAHTLRQVFEECHIR